jgi:hypothetical protein
MKLEIQLQHEKLKSKNEANEVTFTKQFNSDMIIFNSTLSSFNKHKSALSISKNSNNDTHIENIEATKKNVTVYSLTGVTLRTNVNSHNATEGLPIGIYIIDNKKVLVK